jgi:hypothetical protein
MSGRPPEAERDQLESSFTPILRRMWDATPALLSAAFVDFEGECIDYVSALSPFEAKVCGAHARVLMDNLGAARCKLGLTEPVLLLIGAAERELWARRVSDEYLLTAVLQPGTDHGQVAAMLASAGREFRDEVGVPTPPWEPRSVGLEVIVRAAVGWPYAPAAYSQEGVRIRVTDVLGRWVEPSERGDELVCFRVRTEEGQELTLVHDPDGDGWQVRP